jgi:sirohydrochlorin cobaltochelatase
VRLDLSDAALVLLGHGTTLNENSAAVVYQHAAELRHRHIFVELREAFWKQEPHILKVLAAVSAPPLLFIVPMFISEGYFSDEVIPRELGFPQPLSGEGARVLHRAGQKVLYCKPIGTHDRMTAVVLQRAREVTAPSEIPPLAETTLILAGHGTDRNPKSRKSIDRQVALLRAKNLYADVHAVFLDEEPPIATCYELARTRNLIIVPFFISDGLHTQEDIPILLGEPRDTVEQRLQRGQSTWKNPTSRHGKLVWYSASVGGASQIAEVILDRVHEAAPA